MEDEFGLSHQPSSALRSHSRPKLAICGTKHFKRLSADNLNEMRPRTGSLPTRNDLQRPQLLSTAQSTDRIYRVRSFEITSKGVVNMGDSFKATSQSSILSSGSSMAEQLRASSRDSVLSDSRGWGLFKVCVLGAAGVGKSSLIQQFMTSEYIGGFGSSIDEDGAQVVTVLLDGVESDLLFAEANSNADGDSPIEFADSYVVIYSTTCRTSFQHALKVICKLRNQDGSSAPIILTANKSDLVRTRVISTGEGKSVAETYNCKFIETSIILNHHVDELLVGVLSQLRLERGSAQSPPQTSCYKHKTGCFIDKIMKKDKPPSKSCENLYVA